MSERKGIIKRLGPFTFFLAKKIAFLIAAMFISLSLIFVIPHLMPMNPAQIMAERIIAGNPTALNPAITTSTGSVNFTQLEAIYARLFGINQSIYTQFLDFWHRIFTFNFGLSYMSWPTPVSTMVLRALPWTLALVIPALLCGFVIGNRVGSRAAYNRGKLDNLLYYVSLYLFQAPYYWFALIFLFIFAVYFRLFPMFGAYSFGWLKPTLSLNWFLDSLNHYILPFLSLLGTGIGGWAIGMRAMTVYEMESDYMQYSKQLGFTSSKLRQYAQHNAILPNLTWVPVAIAGLIGQTLLVEIVFGWPGLGTLMYYAVLNLDYPIIEASFMIVVLIVLVGNFVADMVYGLIDPRIATGYVGGK